MSLLGLNENISFCEQPKENYQELINEVKAPTTGMIAIFEILKCHPKELFITGFTFAFDSKHQTYVDKYYKYSPPKKSWRINKKGFAGSHNMVAELNFTKKLF